MREVVKRPVAETDLQGIWSYTFEHWGEDQAGHYLREIDACIKDLAKRPDEGKSLETVRAGYSSIRVNRHLIVYTFTDETLVIERVLHDRMDIGQHV